LVLRPRNQEDAGKALKTHCIASERQPERVQSKVLCRRKGLPQSPVVESYDKNGANCWVENEPCRPALRHLSEKNKTLDDGTKHVHCRTDFITYRLNAWVRADPRWLAGKETRLTMREVHRNASARYRGRCRTINQSRDKKQQRYEEKIVWGLKSIRPSENLGRGCVKRNHTCEPRRTAA